MADTEVKEQATEEVVDKLEAAAKEQTDDAKQEQPEAQQPEEDAQSKKDGIDYDKLASILDGRQKANEETVLKGYFKENGLTGDEVSEAIKAFKDKRAAEQPDVGGMESRIAELERSVNVAKVENAVIVEATKMGIDPKAIPYLTRMADLTDVGDASGAVSAEKVATALGKVLDDLPALKPQAQEQTGFRIGGEGDKDAQPPSDDSKLKAIFGVK